MVCPNDQKTLLMSEKHGIEIDYCPECRGVWLDRGELEKIIERSDSNAQSRGFSSGPAPHYDDDSHHYNHRKKKDSFFGDLFDF